MRVLLDECVDRRLAADIQGHDVKTVPEAGWAALKNGDLLTRAQHEFDALVTTDRNLPFQQDLSRFFIAVIVLRAQSNRVTDLRRLIPELLAALPIARRGAVTWVAERMTATSVDDFNRLGFLVVQGAVPPSIVRACVDVIEDELRVRGIDARDPVTWTEPVVRIPCPEGPAFTAAGTSSLLWHAYDALLGPGRWLQREGVGGTIPVRFPSPSDPGDTGWHIDGSYDVEGRWWVNVHSRRRGLLALFLFTDVSEKDAPTEFIPGSSPSPRSRIVKPSLSETMATSAWSSARF